VLLAIPLFPGHFETSPSDGTCSLSVAGIAKQLGNTRGDADYTGVYYKAGMFKKDSTRSLSHFGLCRFEGCPGIINTIAAIQRAIVSDASVA
jgi:hypothetical protein